MLSEWPGDKSPELDVLLYGFYKRMPGLFGNRGQCLYKLNGRIPKSVSWGIVKLIRKELSKGRHH